MSKKQREFFEINTSDIKYYKSWVQYNNFYDTDDDELLVIKAQFIEKGPLDIEEDEVEAFYKRKDLSKIWGFLATKYSKDSIIYICMYLYYYLGLSHRQIGKLLNISYVSCYKYTIEAIKALKKEVTQNNELFE